MRYRGSDADCAAYPQAVDLHSSFETEEVGSWQTKEVVSNKGVIEAYLLFPDTSQNTCHRAGQTLHKRHHRHVHEASFDPRYDILIVSVAESDPMAKEIENADNRDSKTKSD